MDPSTDTGPAVLPLGTPSGGYDPQGRPRVIVHPAQPYDPTDDFAPTAKTAPPISAYDPSEDFAPGKGGPERQTGRSEAALGGVAQGATLGFAPALEGVAAASGTPAPETPIERASGAAAARPIIGAIKLAHDEFLRMAGVDPNGMAGLVTGQTRTPAEQAYDKGRQDALDNQALEFKQHPEMYMAGQLAGTLMTPVPGVGIARAAGIGGRILQGARAGAIGGGLYGVGEATSEGQEPADVAKAGLRTGAAGLVLGGALGGVIGPRAPRNPAVSPGAEAARTAEAMGTPLPQGLTSDTRAVQSATAASASVPLFGARVRNQVEAATEAAGEQISQSGMQRAIDQNRAAIDAGYDTVRNQIDPNLVMPMPRTRAALQRVRQRRVAARQPNPDQGLDQFDNIANQGASFNGAHRARMDAREAGDVLQPHPGYNAADYNEIVRAMTGDLRANVYQQGAMRTLGRPGAAPTNARRALAAFDRAEENFGPLSEANRFLRRMQNIHGTDAGLEMIGFNPATNRFSLDKFITAFNKINPEARPFVPEAAHRANIEAIFRMGSHVKMALGERNTSHTSTPLIMIDLARDTIIGAAAMGTGAITAGSAGIGAAAASPLILFMHWASRPDIAAPMGRWSIAYQGLLGSRTPARVAAFNVATRNLANALGVPVENIVRAVAHRAEVAAGLDQQPDQPRRGRPNE